MGEVLSGDGGTGGRRIVLVVDNLDRVSRDDALSVWAVLQTFVETSEHSQPDWFRRFWIIIPYDECGLSRLWSEQFGKETELAWSFIEKRILVNFQVPRPVLSDRHEYLLSLLKQALPQCAPAFHDIYRLHEKYWEMRRSGSATSVSTRNGNTEQTGQEERESPSSKKRHAANGPTPRNLIQYVNGIGAVYRQWGDEIPLVDAGYYVLLEREHDADEIVELLRSGSVPEREVASLLSEDVAGHLAALLFNTEKGKARQLLLRDPLVDALDNGDVDALEEFARITGFWEVLETIDIETVVYADSSRLASWALCLNKTGLLRRATRRESETVRNRFHRAAGQVESWEPFNEVVGRGVAALCREVDCDMGLARALIGSISLSLIPDEEGEVQGGTAYAWVDGVLVVLDEIDNLGLSESYATGMVVEADVNRFLGICNAITAKDPEGRFWGVFRPRAKPKEVSGSLGRGPDTGLSSQALVAALRVLRASAFDLDLKPAINSMFERLKGDKAPPSAEFRPLLEEMHELSHSNDIAKQRLETLGTQGHVLHHLNRALSDKDDRAMACCVFAYLWAVPDVAAVSAIGQSAQGYAQLIELFKKPENWEGAIQQFVSILDTHDEFALLLGVFRRAEAARPFVCACLDHAGASGKLQALLDETSGGVFAIEDSALYTALLAAGGASNHAFRGWCVAGLQGVSQDVWDDQIREKGDSIDLLLEMSEAEIEVELQQEYRDALLQHAKDLMSGAVSLPDEYTYAVYMMKALRESDQRILREEVCRAATRAGGDIKEEFFGRYGGLISNRDALRKVDGIVRDLLIPLLTERNGGGLRWLADALEEQPGLLDDLSEADAMRDFKERIQKEISGGEEDEAHEAARRIGESLGLEPGKPGT